MISSAPPENRCEDVYGRCEEQIIDHLEASSTLLQETTPQFSHDDHTYHFNDHNEEQNDREHQDGDHHQPTHSFWNRISISDTLFHIT